MDKIYLVKNRSSSVVAYSIPEEHIRRQFAPGEIKKISHEELEKLTYQSGGENLIRNYLQIADIEAAQEFNAGIPVEPEYNLDEAGVKRLLINGSLDELLDALDFAPIGVIDLIKVEAVKLPLGDIPKLNAIKAKTGFDCAAAIRHNEEEKAAEAEENKKETDNIYDNGGRRRAVSTEQVMPQRRVSENKYNIVSINND